MATVNPFDLLGDDDNDDPSQLIAAQQNKIEPKKAPIQTQAQKDKAAKLPSKPLPPTQADGVLALVSFNVMGICGLVVHFSTWTLGYEVACKTATLRRIAVVPGWLYDGQVSHRTRREGREQDKGSWLRIPLAYHVLHDMTYCIPVPRSRTATIHISVREAKSEVGRGRGSGGGRGYGRGRGGGGFNRDSGNEKSFSNSGYSGVQGSTEETDTGKPSERRGGYGGPRGSVRGGRRGALSNGEAGDGEQPRRVFERRSGTGRGNEFKREGAGRGNWGIQTDEIAQMTEEVVNEGEKNLADEKPSGEEDATNVNKENPTNEPEEKEPEDKVNVFYFILDILIIPRFTFSRYASFNL
ncbi:hyaluronan [Actinidia rufa]|uniref:Hyaluronan n=1 Tax=Actinidia rufa TaxID=165716 RepID=A0A7J0F2V6_9ERIC|nr:hyaluronan [Actinidia rufa]